MASHAQRRVDDAHAFVSVRSGCDDGRRGTARHGAKRAQRQTGDCRLGNRARAVLRPAPHTRRRGVARTNAARDQGLLRVARRAPGARSAGSEQRPTVGRNRERRGARRPERETAGFTPRTARPVPTLLTTPDRLQPRLRTRRAACAATRASPRQPRRLRAHPPPSRRESTVGMMLSANSAISRRAAAAAAPPTVAPPAASSLLHGHPVIATTAALSVPAARRPLAANDRRGGNRAARRCFATAAVDPHVVLPLLTVADAAVGNVEQVRGDAAGRHGKR
eukprot:351638-Chlamydomonas_euryale.AAC.4